MKTGYKNIFDRVGIGEKTYLTFASGGSFSKYSHEFQTITDAGEDKIFLCEKCGVAINSELKESTYDVDSELECPECGSKDLVEKKAIEVGNIFKLKTKYSEPFGLKFTDENGDKKDVIMGCYGIGLGRLLGTIAEINHDDKGIIWPEAAAPFTVHLLALGGETAKARANRLYNDLRKREIEVLYDDREDASPGEKFADADLIGIPYRVVVSEKTLAQDKVEIKRRDSEEIKLVNEKELLKVVTSNDD
jgi:prolyl-tRNA synthetase